MAELLWSDPCPKKELEKREDYEDGWAASERGAGFEFTEEVVEKFLQDNCLDLIVRAHMVVEDGYEFFAKRRLVTVFSAPNYMGEYDNCAGIMNVDETLKCSFTVLKPVGRPTETKEKDGAATDDGQLAERALNRFTIGLSRRAKTPVMRRRTYA